MAHCSLSVLPVNENCKNGNLNETRLFALISSSLRKPEYVYIKDSFMTENKIKRLQLQIFYACRRVEKLEYRSQQY